MSAVRKLENPERVSDISQLSSNKRVLVVEDEPEIVATYKSILTSKTRNLVPLTRSSRGGAVDSSDTRITGDFDLVVCTNSEEAMREVERSLVEGKPFAMGFFDVVLQGSRLDGISLVHEIFKIDKNLKAVFVTAYQDRSVDSINSLLGTEHSDRWDYLNKPFSQGEILQKSRNLCAMWNLERARELQDKMLLEAQQRLMESDRFSTVAAVARSVCHEFGNLLVHIAGNAELHKSGTEREKSYAFDVILSACDTAKGVLEKLKGLADNRVFEERLEVFNAEEPLEVAIRLLEHQFKTQNIKVCKVKMESVPIEGDKGELVQVFVNLFINALHAMATSGQIDLSVSKVGDFVEILVHDYGPGIPQKLLNRVTEPLFTTKGKEGTGLGLSICKEIIEIQHQGEFKIQNHSSKGAVVSIRIPIYTKQELADGRKV